MDGNGLIGGFATASAGISPARRTDLRQMFLRGSLSDPLFDRGRGQARHVGLLGLMKSVAMELGRYNVNAIILGLGDTPLTHGCCRRNPTSRPTTAKPFRSGSAAAECGSLGIPSQRNCR